MREKRQYQRARLDAQVTIRLSPSEAIQVKARDISLGGMFLCGLCPANLGASVTVVVSLQGGKELTLPAYLRWKTADGFGLQFGLIGARETHAIGAYVKDPPLVLRSSSPQQPKSA